MASRHHSLDLSEIADVTDLVLGFEQHNTVRLAIRFGLSGVSKGPSLSMTGEAWELEREDGEAKCLASVSVECSTLNLRTWNAALTHLLYALDFRLALPELEQGNKKS